MVLRFKTEKMFGSPLHLFPVTVSFWIAPEVALSVLSEDEAGLESSRT